MKKEQKQRVTLRKVVGVIGVILCLLILPILVINIVLIIESYVNPKEVPSLLGITPMVVVTDSMKPTITGGDMILDVKVPAEEVQPGDIISFFDPTRPDRDVVITHRVIRVEESGGELSFVTKGDANNTIDIPAVPASCYVGVYRTTIPVLGGIVLFMRTTLGVIVTVIVPVLAVIAYELLKARKKAKEGRTEAERLRREVKELKTQSTGPEATADPIT